MVKPNGVARACDSDGMKKGGDEMATVIRGTGTLIEWLVTFIAWFCEDFKSSLVKSFYSQDLEDCFLANLLRFFYIPEVVVRHICFFVHSFFVLLSAFTILIFVYLCIDRYFDGIFTGTKYW